MNRQVKVIQDFLPENLHNEIYNVLTNNKFPWYYSSSVSSELEPKNKKDFFFYHNLYLQNYVSNDYFHQLLMPILGRLNFNYIIRSKINLYPKTDKLYHHPPHIDYKFKHKGCIYSLNSCDGGTKIGNKLYESIENQALLFNPSVPHNSTTCTNTHARFNININYF